ncbi:hypothetical protein VTH06DRAFT_6761 [Thermothelomyces fergusii]
MPRYGFSSRWADSPFSSQDGVPDVTSEDYSYITSHDIENDGLDLAQHYGDSPHDDGLYSHSAPPPTYASLQRPEDDVLLLKHQGVTYPEHFPAYSIGDGKLLVSDLRERVRIILNLSERQAKRTKLYYKGRRLKRGDMPVCEYGVKNNSEILLILGEPNRGSESETGEDVVVAGQDERDRYRIPLGSSPRIGRSTGWEDHSPRFGVSQAGLEVPADDSRRRASSRVRTRSPKPAVSRPKAYDTGPVGRPGGPIEKLNALAAEFDTTWLPQCVEFIERTPLDPKKREEEHRKLSEMVLQTIVMKADEIDATSEEGARAMRKSFVTKVLGILSKVDQAKASA